MPEPKTMLSVIIEANNVVSMASARELYEENMDEFDKVKKMGGEEHSRQYREQLIAEIEETYQQYKAHNESKNIMNVAGTPLTLAFMWICLYLVSQLAALVLLGPVVAVAQYLQLATVLTAAAWGYTKYSGTCPGVGAAVDGWTARVWDLVVRPLVGQVIRKLRNILGRKFHFRPSKLHEKHPS